MSDVATRMLQWFSSLHGERAYQVARNVSMVVGAAVLVRLFANELWTFASGLRAYFLAQRGIGNTDLKKYGPWAVVTGASEGIGKGYALELAKHGLNVVIISRSKDKLQLVADEIEKLYQREVRIIVADYTLGQEVYPQIEEQLQDLDIGILINNVGLSYLHPDYFLAVTKERYRNIVEINCQVIVQMTHLLLPKMLARNRGIIVNLSSISDIAPGALLATYSATKAFVCYFSDALRLEYEDQGIIVQVVSPGMVATAMSNVRRPTFMAPDPLTYAKSAVATIGILKYTQGYWPHALQCHILGKFSRSSYMRGAKRWGLKSREKLLKRKQEGTLISQLRQAQ